MAEGPGFETDLGTPRRPGLVLYPRTKGFESYSFQGNLRILKDVVGKDIPVIVLTKTIKRIAQGHLFRRPECHDVLGLAYANQGRIVPALESLGQALRLAPSEEFIRKHYLQVRAIYIERARKEILRF